ncbi:NAD kinase [Cytophagaceae bacterium DM2B3-1]|uniref:NAD kinase n=2 Tax=Xanthocytophaga TaxID=3078918 RepID=A0AAE3QPM7_9BACT|nr:MULTISPECIES: NAD kinase [Xanthocytophaga]MDJ1469759.1 NAD kinase [Xanthocytophaga flavus]MDJ1483162.1 NAD kinase [Xanthocytophaga flavus]MDJ1494271.1 NAD kinase [Xanthocytophaga flavus]MDJ1504447.1 NAD kinase [Xanthocytophaga agilis]
MKIVIHGRNFKEETKPYIQELFDELTDRGVEIQLSEPFELFLQKMGIQKKETAIYSSRSQIMDADFFFSIGGDGTLLEAITHIGSRQIPILGINTGRLGFLATTAPEKAGNALDNLFNGHYTFDDRTMIHLESDRDLFEGLPFGLNEFTITRRDTSSMITVHTFIDGEYLNSYWADGLIVSTPTGSTAYSLSCGGPVVLPQSSNLIITPVSPHNLNVRPLVVSDSSVISFEIEGRSRYYLVSLDSRSRAVDSTVQLAVRKENFKARLVKMNHENFLYTLRNKLNWGYDVRN